MRSSLVSVLLPVFNGEKYVANAIDSILVQTHSDFELLIIDDGSTDRSVEIVESFDDPRIRLIKNPKNQGLIATLNSGIELASGEYIARMDADDICLPTRLAEQVAILERQNDVAVVASIVDLINSSGNKAEKVWRADRECVSMEDIIQRLPIENCVAHPSVMVRTEVLKKFGYSSNCVDSEDYDLWLRMAAAGIKFHKIGTPLLLYRLHDHSVTAATQLKRYDVKNIRVKLNFLKHLLIPPRMPSEFDRRVIARLGRESWSLGKRFFVDYARGGIGLVSRYFGRLCGLCVPRVKSGSLYFFFPAYHIGGSEKVHADILRSIKGEKPTIVITGRSKDETFKRVFEDCGRVIDISAKLKFFFGTEFMVGYWVSFIGKCEAPVTLGSNNGFYYYFVRYLPPQVRACDLLHAFGTGFEFLSLPVAERLNKRIVINEQLVVDLQKLYQEKNLDAALEDRARVIENCVDVPVQIQPKGINRNLQVLYVGRGTSEKRVHLVAEIAARCDKEEIAADFILVGDVENGLTSPQKDYCTCVGPISDQAVISDYYNHADILLITSTREGFPVVVMEGMAHGVIPICTDVGGIHYHVRNGETGFLVESHENESDLVGRFVDLIEELSSDEALLESMSLAVHEYAKAHFARNRFEEAYRHELQVGCSSIY